MAVDTTQDARKKFTMAAAQENLYSHNVARRICEVNTKDMGTIYNPYTSLPATTDATTTGASYNVASYDAAADSIQVNKRAYAAEHVDSYDWKSVGFDLISNRGAEFGRSISQQIDRSVFGNVVGNGGFALGDGGTDGSSTPWTSSSTVIDDIINAGIENIDAADGHGQKKFMVVTAREANDLRGFMQSNGHNVADDAIRSGIPFVGTTFSGVDVFQSNNLRNTVVLDLATNPTDGDTITINGVVITFVATLSGGAGEVHIASTVDITRANLTAFLTGTNQPGDTAEAEATDTGYAALSSADSYKLGRLAPSFANDNTANEMTITSNGLLTVSKTLTDGTDAWTAVQRQLVIGNYGSMFLALPGMGMDYQEKQVSGKAGSELFMEQFHNETIWTRKQDQVGTVLVN